MHLLLIIVICSLLLTRLIDVCCWENGCLATRAARPAVLVSFARCAELNVCFQRYERFGSVGGCYFGCHNYVQILQDLKVTTPL
jgi:hypothetical protein